MNPRIVKIITNTFSSLGGTKVAAKIPLLHLSHYLFEPQIIYVPKLNIAYLPIQKVANTSIRRAIQDSIGEANYLQPKRSKSARNQAEYDFIPARKFENIEGCFSFAFVRNPLDRLYSCYKDKTSGKGGGHENLFWRYGNKFNQGMSFREFVHAVSEVPDVYSDRHFRSQSSFLFFGNRCAVDFIGKLENVDKDWDYIKSRCALGNLPQRNKTLGESWKDQYSPDLAVIASRRYEKDIHAFGYRSEVEELINR